MLQSRIARIRNGRYPDSNNATTIRIGLIGSLDVRYKGHDTAIRALSLLNRNEAEPKTRFKLHLLGAGESTHWVNLASSIGESKSIVFEGIKPSGNQVLAWIDDMDLMLQPSTVEAQGRSIIEAMSRACPVVATRVGGIPELIAPELLSVKRNHRQLCEIVFELLKNKAYLEATAETNWKKASEFSTSTIERVRKTIFDDFIHASQR